MTLKYPIHYTVETPSPYANEALSLCAGFSQYFHTVGPCQMKASQTRNLTKAIKHAVEHNGSVVAHWLEDKPSESPVASSKGYRHDTWGRKTVFGDRVLADNNWGNAPLEFFIHSKKSAA